MVRTKDQIKAAALALGPVEREELAEDLLSSIGDGDRGRAELFGAREGVASEMENPRNEFRGRS
jgi:hypothetical protein